MEFARARNNFGYDYVNAKNVVEKEWGVIIRIT